MRKQPRINEPDNPLISIFVYGYYKEYLKKCFDTILSQTILDNIEIIYLDNETTDGSWEIALTYAQKHDGIFTLQRNKRMKSSKNFFHCQRLSKGKYYVTLTENETFRPEYVHQCVRTMEHDPLASFNMIRRSIEDVPARPNFQNQPLVSVLTHNMNYGRYLRQCLDSVFTQTYQNVEVILSDNASTDDSWEIAVDYAARYPGQITLIRNRSNFGPNKNLENCYDNITGKYFFVLCSDDALHPEFIRCCVDAMEDHPNVGLAMTHRCIINDDGTLSKEPPFYNQSCIIPGAEQAAVYMMAAVNPSVSQVMYNHEKSLPFIQAQNILSRWYSQRYIDFNLCCQFDMAYIQEPLLMHRVHSTSDSHHIANSLVELFGQYILPHQFTEIALSKNDMTKAIERLPHALEKLGRLCLRYSANALINSDENNAQRCFHLAVAINPKLHSDPVFLKIDSYWRADSSKKETIINHLKLVDNLTSRDFSYDPPPGSVPFPVEGLSD